MYVLPKLSWISEVLLYAKMYVWMSTKPGEISVHLNDGLWPAHFFLIQYIAACISYGRKQTRVSRVNERSEIRGNALREASSNSLLKCLLCCMRVDGRYVCVTYIISRPTHSVTFEFQEAKSFRGKIYRCVAHITKHATALRFFFFRAFWLISGTGCPRFYLAT